MSFFLSCVQTHLPPVEVLDDREVQVLLPLPLALHGVVEELSERPVGPFQQLVIQQQRVRCLCDTHTHMWTGDDIPAKSALVTLQKHEELTPLKVSLKI